jgi:hypothetical protein
MLLVGHGTCWYHTDPINSMPLAAENMGPAMFSLAHVQTALLAMPIVAMLGGHVNHMMLPDGS